MDEVLVDIKRELSNHDLGAALALTNKIPEVDLKSYKTWISQAKNRQFINDSFLVLETSALNHLLNDENKTS